MSTVTLPADNSTEARVHEAVKKVTMLATLPEVTARIVSTVEDPKSTASALHKIVAHDPALVTRILKVVNSAFYGLPGQIGSVERAIVLLGLNAVKNIAVAASLGQLFRGVQLCEGYTAKDLWTHCIAVGVTARELARQMKLPIADEAFLAGMIHDIGILISLQLSPERLRQVCETVRTSGADFCAVEHEIIGMDHQQLGAALAELWKFPRPCQLVAGYHHQPAQLGDESRALVTLVHAADILCCRAGQGFNLTAQNTSPNEAALAAANIDPALLERTTAKIPELVASASSLLG
ncbi:MAG: HDOD domain-containing protein [Tepidisphaeraceae bacterium]